MKTKTTQKDRNLYKLATQLRVSRSTLYQWKEQGCPVDEGEDAVTAWAMREGKGRDQPADDTLRAAKLAVLRETAAGKRTARLKAEDKLIPIDVVEAGRAIAVRVFCGELERIKRDMPAILKGLDEQGIREKLTAHIATIRPRIVEAFEKIGEEQRS